MNNRKLKSLRVEYGLTQKDMANLIKMPVSTYVRKELGNASFTVEEAFKISSAFKISIEDIFFTQQVPKWNTNKIIAHQY
ncbi:helix-turn-helix transcriptional regulator [Terrisporobacter hibernicus]|uniref:Helix-turn-helix domain-containing protein n=1 Tax=Terrisporobacter hibernicus TaxID=2813371 RepID=A0AAX2ZDK0_9FIRM|nr:helix-turn-helix transcriptional regulator [Terrisporobacter hibernicus]UEL47328.1 helix-turn-helix domain-containing protein [Terrisporobacter hibernicus]